MNTAAFLADQRRHFSGAYEQFVAFGGPCVYFHRECILAGEVDFLSDRHLEMLYATLASWGMHRMGDTYRTKTKLTNWDVFRESLRGSRDELTPLLGVDLLDLTERQYSEAVSALGPCYRKLRLSESAATIVVNSKALYHLLPRLIPPIDRQYTVRFFQHPPDRWRDAKGKFRAVILPSGLDAQFRLFHSICVSVKRLADQVDRTLLSRELLANRVTGTKGDRQCHRQLRPNHRWWRAAGGLTSGCTCRRPR